MDYTYDYVLMFFRAERAWGQDILNEIYGGDLDEMIDCQWEKSRAVWYFYKKFLRAILMKWSIVNRQNHVRSDMLTEIYGGDLDSKIDFQKVWTLAVWYFLIFFDYMSGS